MVPLSIWLLDLQFLQNSPAAPIWPKTAYLYVLKIKIASYTASESAAFPFPGIKPPEAP
jgi:hypothetical protein